MSRRNSEAWRIRVTSHVAHDLLLSRPADRELVFEGLAELEQGPYAANTRKLDGRPEWCLQIGKRRAIFRPDFDDLSITILDILPR